MLHYCSHGDLASSIFANQHRLYRNIYLSKDPRGKEHRKCISISDLDAPQKVMPLIPSGQTEISTDTSSVLLDSVTPNCEQEESEELSMLSNP